MAKPPARSRRQSPTRSATTAAESPEPSADTVVSSALEGALLDVLQAVVGQATALLKGDGGGFYLADPGGRTLRCVVASGTPSTVLGTVLRYGEGAAGKVAETGQPVNVEDYRTWSGRSPQFERSAPFRAVVSVPTSLHGLLMGVLHVLRTGPGTPFAPEDVELLGIFANQAAVALENARLLEETNRRVRQLSILNELTRAALAASDLGSTAQALAENMSELVGADGCHLALWDEAEGLAVPTAASGILRGRYSQDPPRPGQITLTESCLRAGRPLPVEDCLDTPYLSPEIAATCPYRSMLGVPLIVGSRWMGAALLAYQERHVFEADEIALCQQAAGQVALALAKVQSFEAESQHRSELESLRRASLRLTSTLELRPVLEALLEEALHLVEAHDANLFFYEGGALTFGAALWGGAFQARPFS